MPNTWVPLYNSVTFTHMPYKQCIENRAWQDGTLTKALKYGGFITIFALGFGTFQLARRLNFDFSSEELLNKLKF